MRGNNVGTFVRTQPVAEAGKVATPAIGNTEHRNYNTTVGTVRSKTLDFDSLPSCSNTKRTRTV